MRSFRKIKNFRHCMIIFMAILLLIGPDNLHWLMNTAEAQPINPPRTTPNLQELVQALIDATPIDANDTDGDSLPDLVEIIIGTDPNSTDSDLDRLDDSLEVENDLDPLDPDSNHDGLPDYYEVNDVPSLDIDGDGFENAWDFDNDGDGINDNVDYSPFSRSALQENFHFDITTEGNTLYMSFQLRPKNPEHLKLFERMWDWPDNDTEGTMQDRDASKEDVTVIPTLALTVSTPPEQNDVERYGITVNDDNVSVPLLPVFEHGSIVAFTGRMVYPNSAPNDLDMDVKLVWKVIGKNDPVDPNDPKKILFGQDTLLATYGEDFTLTGMSFEENYGSDAGLVYSSDINQTVAANLLLAYEFLRNSDNQVHDMPGVLDSNDVNVACDCNSFAHRDEGFASMMDDMIPKALNLLPEDQNLPFIAILENTSATLDMSEFQCTSLNSFSVDLSSVPVKVSKTLKTTWYNTSSREALLTGDVMAQIQDMGLEETASYALMTLMLYWETGEYESYNINNPPIGLPEDFELIYSTVKEILMSLDCFEKLYDISNELKDLISYPSVKSLQMKGWNPSIAGKPQDLAKMGNLEKPKGLAKNCGKIKNTVGEFKSMDKLMKGIEIVGLAVDLGVSIYSIVAICESDAGGFAKSSALTKVGLEIGYSIVMFGIAFIPVAGEVIALVIALSDFFGNWTDIVFDFLAGLIVDVSYELDSEVNFLGEPKINIDINDKDDNGLDVGDRITLSTRLQGKILGNKAHWGLVEKSSIWPYHLIFAPDGSLADELYWFYGLPIGTPHPTGGKNQGWKAWEYDAGGWVEPGTAMVDFPVTIKTEAQYDIWYEYKWVGIFAENDHESGTTDPNWITLRFDVLPGSIEDFVSWCGITPLDRDGDGLPDANDAQIANPWLYDTDGDGLNDKYELDNLTDPKKYDTDGDGLIDWFEIQFGTDPLNFDTDEDGLMDYLEVAGWLIEFSYQDQSFTTRVYSDPTIPDSDGDEVSDEMEYRSGLNPRSRDTNGDGVIDMANPKKDKTVLQLVSRTEIESYIDDIDVDANGFVYLLVRGHIFKFDSDLNHIREWTAEAGGDDLLSSASSMVIDDKNGLIHVAYIYGDLPGETGIITFNLADGTRITPQPWAVEQLERYDVIEMDVDADGNLYVLRRGSECVKDQFDPVRVKLVCQVSTKRAHIDVYDVNCVPVKTWGRFATLENEYDSENEIWHFYYVSEPNVFNYIKDLAIRDDGKVFIPEDGTLGTLYKWIWAGHNIGYWDSESYTIRDDRIAEYDIDGQYYRDIFSFIDPNSGQTISLSNPTGVAVDDSGNIYIVSNYMFDGNIFPIARIFKFDENLIPVATWTIDSWAQTYTFYEYGSYLEKPPPHDTRELVVDVNENIYTYCSETGEVKELSVIEKYLQKPAPPVEDPNPDSDGDGLLNEVETSGWDITFTDPNNTHTVHVTSDPLLADTDLDGLPDPNEYDIGSNPRNPDTDSDGLSDFDDVNPIHFDADGDGLSDGTEMAYGSDPNAADTDQDGLTDFEECELESDPNNADTDRDGVSDSEEKSMNSDLKSPDSDGDLMFDAAEVDSGTDLNNSDTDQDGLADGVEVVYNTDPLNADSDNDGLTDGFEADEHLNPASSDTDNDGVPDKTELDQGTNPWSKDSDHDGVPDGQDDPDNLAPDVKNAHPNKEYLWPPNNKFVEITIEGVTDPEGDPVEIWIIGVTSDEPSTTSRGDKKTPDALISASGKLLLRAERSGSGNGRVYEISFVAGDSKGEYTQGKVQVKVPHSKGKKHSICIDDGQKYNLLQW